MALHGHGRERGSSALDRDEETLASLVDEMESTVMRAEHLLLECHPGEARRTALAVVRTWEHLAAVLKVYAPRSRAHERAIAIINHASAQDITSEVSDPPGAPRRTSARRQAGPLAAERVQTNTIVHPCRRQRQQPALGSRTPE